MIKKICYISSIDIKQIYNIYQSKDIPKTLCKFKTFKRKSYKTNRVIKVFLDIWKKKGLQNKHGYLKYRRPCIILDISNFGHHKNFGFQHFKYQTIH